MTREQRQKIVALSLASRKASEVCGLFSGLSQSATGAVDCHKQQAEDAYAALMAAIFDATEADERTNEWIESPAELQKI